jgi:hypothetical protein
LNGWVELRILQKLEEAIAVKKDKIQGGFENGVVVMNVEFEFEMPVSE